MDKYLSGELYKVTHRSYLYVAVGTLAVMVALLVGIWSWVNQTGEGMLTLTSSAGLEMVVWVLSVGYYATAIIADLVFSEQYKHNTLKNEVAFGLPRTRIYLGKLAAELLVALVVCALTFLWYGLLCRFLLPPDEGWMEAMSNVGIALLAALPVWVGCLSFLHMLFFLMKSTTAATFIVVGILAMGGQLTQMLSMLVSDKFLLLYNILLTSPLDGIIDHMGDWSRVAWGWAVGVGWTCITTAVGLALFRKKEIS